MKQFEVTREPVSRKSAGVSCIASVSICHDMMQVLMWTLLAAVLLTTEAVMSTAQTVVPQARTGRVTVFQDEPAFTADVSADGRLAAVFTQPYGNGTNQTPARIEIRNLQTGERITLAGGVSNVGTPGVQPRRFRRTRDPSPIHGLTRNCWTRACCR